MQGDGHHSRANKEACKQDSTYTNCEAYFAVWMNSCGNSGGPPAQIGLQAQV